MAALSSLRQLRYLVALAEQLNFTRAAQACFVGQSTLSAGLKELESALGLQLVERDRKSVALTEAGVEVVARARALLAAADDLVECAQRMAAPQAGSVRLGVIPTIAPFLLPKMLPLLRKRIPGLRLTLREDLTANLIQKLTDRQLDFCLIALPYDTAGLRVRELFSDEFWLAAPVDDPTWARSKLTLPHSLTERLLLLEEGHCLRDQTLLACGRSEVASGQGVEATSLLTLVQMVESGMGVALLPEMAIKAGLLNHTRVIARPTAAPAPRRQIALVTRPSLVQTDLFETLAQCLIDCQKPARQALRASRAAR